MHANSIDEYLKLKSQGCSSITMETGNKELFDFVMNELEMDVVENLKKCGIHTANNQYYYDEDSRFPFGKHKKNPLKYVYKCDPGYIEWCLLNTDSFCIDKDSIKAFQKIRPWNSEDLPLISKGDGNYVLDIRNFQKDKNSYPFSSQIREISFSFSDAALEENSKKLAAKLNPWTVLRGSNWTNSKPIWSGPKNKITILFG